MEECVKAQVRGELDKSLKSIMPKGPKDQRKELQELIEQVENGQANS